VTSQGFKENSGLGRLATKPLFGRGRKRKRRILDKGDRRGLGESTRKTPRTQFNLGGSPSFVKGKRYDLQTTNNEGRKPRPEKEKSLKTKKVVLREILMGSYD